MILLAPPRPGPDYEACIDILRDLPKHLEARQRELLLSNATMARQIGISNTTVTRLYAGVQPSYATALLCLAWLER